MKNSKPYLAALKEMKKKSPNKEKSFKYLQQAYKLGDAGAAYALATWYLHGTYVDKDTKQGTKLLKESISKGEIPEAFYDLAVSHEKGIGVRKSEKKAYELYLNAAIWGHTSSYYEVGRCLYYGIGTEKNRRLAQIWLKRAEALGFHDQY